MNKAAYSVQRGKYQPFMKGTKDENDKNLGNFAFGIGPPFCAISFIALIGGKEVMR